MRRVQREVWYREAKTPGERDFEDMQSNPRRWVEDQLFNRTLPLLTWALKELGSVFGDSPEIREVQYRFKDFLKALEKFFQRQGMPPGGIYRRRTPQEDRDRV